VQVLQVFFIVLFCEVSNDLFMLSSINVAIRDNRPTCPFEFYWIHYVLAKRSDDFGIPE
jgi:hypothetical protein